MAKLVSVCRSDNYPFERRQIPLVVDETLTVSSVKSSFLSVPTIYAYKNVDENCKCRSADVIFELIHVFSLKTKTGSQHSKQTACQKYIDVQYQFFFALSIISSLALFLLIRW